MMSHWQTNCTKVLLDNRMRDSRMRDIRRRVDVIQKKLADLQDMGVPCAFCYSSRSTGSIFTLGDKRITDVIEHHRNEILCNLMEENGLADSELACNSQQEIRIILPILPAPLDELGRTTLQCMIHGIVKDLGIRWSDPKPIWWPEDIPFVPPRSGVPDHFPGKWIDALKRIVQSVYSHYSYDINTYIATKLEPQSRRNLDRVVVKEEGSSQEDLQDEELDEEEEYDGEYSDQSDMEKDGDDVSDHRMQENCLEAIGERAPSAAVSTRGGSPSLSTSKPPNKLMSSFTVENILMGNCSSTGSDVATIAVATPALQSSTTAVATTIHSQALCSSSTKSSSSTVTNTSTSSTSSIVGMNWVSHPPVKYTKFTMLSPTTISDEAQKKKKPPSDQHVHSTKSHRGEMQSLPTSNDARISSHPQLSSSHLVTSSQQTSLRSSFTKETTALLSSPSASSSSSPSSTSSLSLSPSSSNAIQVYSLKEFPASSTSAARLCPLPVVTTLPTISSLDRKSAMTKVFPPSQQYVFIVPSCAVAVPSQTSLSSSSSAAKNVPPFATTNLSELHTTVGPLKPSSCHSVASTATFSSTTTHSDTTPPSTNSTMSTTILSESNNNFRLIAPKQSTPNGTSQEKNINKTRVLKRMSQKPHKLRFHMMTVVTKQKKEEGKGSMTVESPSTISDASNVATETSTTSPSNQNDDVDTNVPVESTITLSPNAYSSAGGRKNREMLSVENEEANEKRTEVSLAQATSQRVPQEDSVVDGTSSILPHTKGRATRNYTRRKRELTFHLYEDPETAFKVKKACKE